MAVDGGAKVLLGGKRLKRTGYFLEPTILTDITPENPAFHVEFFAPVALVFRVTMKTRRSPSLTTRRMGWVDR